MSHVAGCCQSPIDFCQYRWVVDRRRQRVVLTLGDLTHGAAQNLARAGFRQTGDDKRCLEARHRTDAIADELNGFALDLVSRPYDTGLQHQEAERNLPLERIRNADHGAFGNIGMCRQDLLDLPGGEAMGGDIDDVVGSGRCVDVAVAVDEPGIGGLIEAGKGAQISGDEFVVGLPQARQRAGRQWQFDRQRADLPGCELARRALGFGV